MAYLGTYQLGEYIQLAVQTTNADDTPSFPTTTVSITSVSNTSPIVVTAPSHGVTTGATVTIAGNSAANGSWIATSLTVNTFSLNGSTANGAISGGTATYPGRTPTYQIWNSTSNITPGATSATGNAALHVEDRYKLTGYFTRQIFLTPVFALGFYRIYYYWIVGTYSGFQIDYFEIVQGGNPFSGSVVGMHHFSPPHANFVVQHMDGGLILKGRNPFV